MVLDGSRSTDDDAVRLSSPATSTFQGSCKLVSEESTRPAVKPSALLPHGAWYQAPSEQLTELLSKTLKDKPDECHGRAPLEEMGYTELFIEEDEEKDVRVFNERLSTQVEHGGRAV